MLTPDVWEIGLAGAELAPNGTPIMVRGPGNIGWRHVPRTNAWEDEEGNAEYLLRCTRLPNVPKYLRDGSA
jgi:hypothetical protein